MTSLRGHHLICLHFFKGEGYGAAFTENLERVINRAKRESINVQHGADDVCFTCPHLAEGKCEYKEGSNEKIEGLDATALRLLNLQAGAKADWEAIKSMLPQMFSEWKNKVCFECDWLSACKLTNLWKNLD